jgi:hypothetical protein
LAWIGSEVGRLAKDLQLLKKVKTTDRTLPPVQKIICRMRQFIDELEQMIGSAKGVS